MNTLSATSHSKLSRKTQTLMIRQCSLTLCKYYYTKGIPLPFKLCSNLAIVTVKRPLVVCLISYYFINTQVTWKGHQHCY